MERRMPGSCPHGPSSVIHRSGFRILIGLLKDIHLRVQIIQKVQEHGFRKTRNLDGLPFQSTVMGCFDDLDFERKKVIGATMLCNIITQSANLLWHMVYRDNHGRAIKNPHLSAIEKSTHDFANEYHTTNKVIDLNTSEKLKSCVDSLCYKMMHFLDI